MTAEEQEAAEAYAASAAAQGAQAAQDAQVAEVEQATQASAGIEGGEEGDDDGGEGASKRQKMDVNPLTGIPYTRQFYELLEARQQLPAWSCREDFLRLIHTYQVVVLVGAPGGGKSTQLPQILLDAGYHVQDGMIKALACAQPQGAAAISVANRIAEELEVPLGTHVGYRLRFEDGSAPETLLKFLTDEVLLAELLVDPHLERYSVVLLDEVHDRPAAMDVLLPLLKQVLRKRPSLKLVAMADISVDASRLQGFFGDAPMLHMCCQSQPVEICHLVEPERNYVRAAVKAVTKIHASEPEGDVLVFLTSEHEVELACSQLAREAARKPEQYSNVLVVPLFDGLAPAQLQRAWERPPAGGARRGRKIVVATDVAETSVVIGGIAYVVDAGFVRRRFHNPRTRLETTLAAPVSQVGAKRRASCAGRSARPGKCFRLYTERSAKEELPPLHYPEVMRSGLSGFVLIAKKLGVDDPVHFELLDPPAPEALMRALESLHYLGCIDDDGAITEVGDQTARFPLEPQLARMLIESPKHRCGNEALSIAAMLCSQPIFLRPQGSKKAADEAKSRFAHLDGDHLTLLNVYHAFKQQIQDGSDGGKFCADNFISLRSMRAAEGTREHLRRIMHELGLQILSTDFQDNEYYPNIRRCMVTGFFMQVAHVGEKERCYLTVKEGQTAMVHPTSCLQHRPEWLLYDRFMLTSQSFLQTVTQVQGEWLLMFAPHFYDLRTFPQSAARSSLEKLGANPRPS